MSSAIGLMIATTLALVGCSEISYRPSAIGQTGEVVVVMDSALWNGQPGDVLREELGRYIMTLPNPEPMFSITHEPLESQAVVDRVTARKNVVFAAALSDTSTESRFVRAAFSPDAQATIEDGQSAFVERQDVWRRNQQVVYLAAPDKGDLTELIRDSGSEMRSSFNLAERQRLQRDMFDKGRQFDLEDSLLAGHDFAIQVQHDYLIAIDTTNFVYLRRILSDTWRSIFVYYEDYADPMALTPEWIYQKRDSLGQLYLLGNAGGFVQIDRRRPLEAENVDFLDRYGFEVRGLWHLVGPDSEGEIVSYGAGGPFLTYAFYDEETGRNYLIDGMVFAPGFDKREFLRQLEVIAHTFKSRTELEPPQIAAAE